MTESGTERWLGRDDLAWNILVVAGLEETPPASTLRERLARLCAREGWPVPGDAGVMSGEGHSLLSMLSELKDSALPVSVGHAADGVVVRGHHAQVDGLGLLAALRDLAVEDLTSSASGVGDRGRRSTVATMAGRLVEALAQPPAGVRGLATTGGPGGPDDFASRTLSRHVGTADLAHAAVQAVAEHNGSPGAPGRRVALAVGVSTVSGDQLRVGDDSGFLRLTSAERLDATAMAQALAEAPLQVGGSARSGSAQRAGGLIRWASKAFSSRLGSTVLVSHLGRVEAAAVTELAFYPLAGNGSGLSVGAATVRGRTTITLRARGSEHAELDDLLDAVVARLS